MLVSKVDSWMDVHCQTQEDRLYISMRSGKIEKTYESCITGINQEHDDYESVTHQREQLFDLLKFIKYAVWNGTRLASERLVPVFVNAETALKSENQVVETCLG
jgi:hypothetical protein